MRKSAPMCQVAVGHARIGYEGRAVLYYGTEPLDVDHTAALASAPFVLVYADRLDAGSPPRETGWVVHVAAVTEDERDTLLEFEVDKLRQEIFGGDVQRGAHPYRPPGDPVAALEAQLSAYWQATFARLSRELT